MRAQTDHGTVQSELYHFQKETREKIPGPADWWGPHMAPEAESVTENM